KFAENRLSSTTAGKGTTSVVEVAISLSERCTMRLSREFSTTATCRSTLQEHYTSAVFIPFFPRHQSCIQRRGQQRPTQAARPARIKIAVEALFGSASTAGDRP